MAQQFEKLSDANKAFIAKQKLFFIASSHHGGEVNLSPRGYDVFRIIDDNHAYFLDYVGSGDRTARDINNDGEVTVLFCSFEGKPLNLRLFCKGELIDKQDETARALFDDASLEGMRRFIKLHIYCVEQSCGTSVPYFEYQGERDDLKAFCVRNEKSGKLDAYVKNHEVPPDLDKYKTVV